MKKLMFISFVTCLLAQGALAISTNSAQSQEQPCQQRMDIARRAATAKLEAAPKEAKREFRAQIFNEVQKR